MKMVEKKNTMVGCAEAQLGLVGHATEGVSQSVAVAAGQCWPRQARFRKTCCHSSDTDLLPESKGFQLFVNLGRDC